MTAPGSGWLRYVRASIVASIGVTLSVAGHVLGRGHAPHPLAVAILVGLAMIPAYVLGGRRLGRGALIGLLGTAQLVIHLALSGAGQSTAHHHDLAVDQTTVAAAPSPLLMVLGHASATIALALLLATGEALLWRLWTWLSARWPQPARLTIRTSPPTRPVAGWFNRCGASVWLRERAAPRGPPSMLDPVAG